MQQYMLQQLDKYMANRAGNQYARQLNVKDKTSLPTTAQKDVMDVTIQGGLKCQCFTIQMIYSNQMN